LTLPNLFKQSTRCFERVSVVESHSEEQQSVLRLTEVLRPSCPPPGQTPHEEQ